MQSALVSIVMPVYNGERYLAEAIESIREQRYPNWELIVVDDGSTDGSRAVVEGFDDPRVRYLYQHNNGQATALNTGLAAAAGEFVTTLDADDAMTADGLAARVAKLQSSPRAGAVYGDGYYFEQPGVVQKRFRDVLPERPSGDVFSALVASPFFGTGANVLIRRSVLERESIRYDESIVWCQDHDLLLRLAAVAQLECVDAPTVWYRQHTDSMTTQTAGKRRLGSVLRMKWKAMRSPKFGSVGQNHRHRFFYDLLIQDLAGDAAGRTDVFGHKSFQALEARRRALLLRLTAADALVDPANEGPALAWLRKSAAAFPFDVKTLLLLAMASVDARAASRAVRRWRSGAEADSPAVS